MRRGNTPVTPPVTVKVKKKRASDGSTGAMLVLVFLLVVMAGGGYLAGLRAGRAEGRIMEHTKAGETHAPANERVRSW